MRNRRFPPRRTVLAAASAVLLCATACRHSAPALPVAGPCFALTDSVLRCGGADTLRLGRLRAGEMAASSFRLRNDSDKPLVLTGTERSCGCTELQFDNRPLLPGEERGARLTFESGGLYGWQFKTVELHFAGAERAFRLYVEAEVE